MRAVGNALHMGSDRSGAHRRRAVLRHAQVGENPPTREDNRPRRLAPHVGKNKAQARPHLLQPRQANPCSMGCEVRRSVSAVWRVSAVRVVQACRGGPNKANGYEEGRPVRTGLGATPPCGMLQHGGKTYHLLVWPTDDGGSSVVCKIDARTCPGVVSADPDALETTPRPPRRYRTRTLRKSHPDRSISR